MMLRRIFHQAVTDGLGDGQPILPANPCKVKTPSRELNSRQERPLTAKEVQDLADAIPGHLPLVVWIDLTAGGLHMGEICALRLGDIDLMDHIIHIKSNVVRRPDSPGYGLTTRPQGNKLPLPRLLESAIQQHATKYCHTDNDDCFLFPVTQEWRLDYPSPAMLQANLRAAFRKISRPDGVYRTLRATYALTFMRNGGIMQETMDILGYATPRAMSQLCSLRQGNRVAKVTDLCSCAFLPPDTNAAAIGTVIDDLEQQRTQLTKTLRRLRAQQSSIASKEHQHTKAES